MQVRVNHLELEIKADFYEALFPASIPAIFDPKTKTWRLLPMYYFKLKDYAISKSIEFESSVNENFDLSPEISNLLKKKFELRPYQEDAVSKLKQNNWRGIIVLPTGAGKTVIGLEAIYQLKCRTLIVVPTLSLINQWVDRINKLLGIPIRHIKTYAADRKEIGEITITTYASARSHDFLKNVVDYFGLIIFDEVHHLSGVVTREIAKRLIAPYRIGLTATLSEKDDNILCMLVGPVFRISTFKELSEKGFLAPFEYKRIYVKLTEEEQKKYDELMKKYLDYVKNLPGEDEIARFRELVKRSVRDRDAREALLSRIEAKRIAVESQRKFEVLEELLQKHVKDKVIIFTRHVDTARYISYKFGIPCITGDTNKKLRKEIISMFEEGIVNKIVTAEALDEGVDIPSASIAIILAGKPSKRQLIQRIGRVLRPLPGKKAIIYEIITRATYDMFAARKRRIKKEEL